MAPSRAAKALVATALSWQLGLALKQQSRKQRFPLKPGFHLHRKNPQSPEEQEQAKSRFHLPQLFKHPEPDYSAYDPPPYKNAYSCQCLHWKAQYYLKNVKCGRGAELASYTVGSSNGEQVMPAYMRVMDNIFCQDASGKNDTAFFPQQDHSLCIRQTLHDSPDQDHGSWCYVSDFCDLPTTFPVNSSKLRAKICQRGKDISLDDNQPGVVFMIARRNNVKFQLMARMAFKNGGQKWDKYAQLAKLRQSKTWRGDGWFEAEGGALKVAWRDQLWHVYPEPTKKSQQEKFPACVEGCRGPIYQIGVR